MTQQQTDNEIYELLNRVQRILSVPKKRYNSFAKYHYRNAEDVLEAIKEILPPGCSVVLSDNIDLIGDRFYMKAEASFNYKGQSIKAYGWAREADEKKGYDPAQITGSASTYARKYALNGLFAIDDSEDVDQKDNSQQAPKQQYEKPKQEIKQEIKPLTVKQSQIIDTLELYEVEKDVVGVRDYWNKCDKGDRDAVKPHMRKPLKEWVAKVVTAPSPQDYASV